MLADRGPGLFGLSARQSLPLNAFVRLDDLQRAMGAPGKINTILLPRDAISPQVLEKRLDDAVGLADAGLIVSADSTPLAVTSRDFVLSAAQVAAIDQTAAALGARTQEVSTYLANELRVGGRSVPYSTVTAIDPGPTPFDGLQLAGGGPAPSLAADEILLDAWAAEDLAAAPGNSVDMTWYVIGEREQVRERTATLRVKGIVAMSGLAIDPTLTPDYPGIKSARHIASWDPPFPVDFRKIRPRDEAYWDRYGPTPKAFVARAAGERLWASRYGSVTSVRIASPAAEPAGEFAQRFSTQLRAKIPLASTGIQVRDLRGEGDAASDGATDFGMLFLAFSSFLIVSSALLSGLLFRLGVEQRAREIGVLLAVGYTVRRVQRRFLAEGVVLAAAGVIPGLAGGAVYAGLLMAGLRTAWRGAVGTSRLSLHVTWQSLVLGGAIAIGIVVLSILVSVWRLGRHPVPALIAGRFGSRAVSRPGRLSRWLASGALVAGVALLVYALATAESSSPALSFGVGACLLVSGLAFFASWCGGSSRHPALLPGRTLLARMAARNSAWNPARSLLSVALIGSACFVILTVAAAGREEAPEDDSIGSAQGGYRLMAESDIPLHQDLDTAQGREALGIAPETAGLFNGVVIMPFRTVPGDDTSCANLYRPGRPRLLGVPEEQIRRGGFRFKSAAGKTDNPWRLLDQPVERDGSDGSDASNGPAEPEVVPAIGDENSVLWILHKGLGQVLSIEDERGEPLKLRFVALLEGSLFQSEILIPEKSLERHFGSRDGYSFFLIEAPGKQAAGLTRVLETALGREGFDVSTVAER
ncbi:MAG TPA: ABC transporter permease, partial [Patescibacteria group bacterium]|nr:ABC transporter permease [Patescibacteria group bacterium]